MWHGEQNYNDGLSGYLVRRKNAALHQKLSNDGTGIIAPFCELSAPRQGDSQPTESPQYIASTITSLHWIIYPTYKRRWLGNSMEPLSDCDRTLIHIILHLRTASQSGAFFAMGVAALLVFGMLIWKDLPKVLHYDNSHPVALLRVLP